MVVPVDGKVCVACALASSSCACARESASSLSCVSIDTDWLLNTTSIAAVSVSERIANAIKISSVLTPLAPERIVFSSAIRGVLPNDRAFIIDGGGRSFVLLREHNLRPGGSSAQLRKHHWRAPYNAHARACRCYFSCSC